MRKAQLLSLIFIFIISGQTFADEGLWIPKLISKQADKMKSLGMAISADEIYSEKNASLKDAVVHFGGGCSSVLVSDKGLLLTNHHCGYSRIQSHSSLENNYLKDGFWAENMAAELPNEGLTASIIISMDNVTKQIMEGISDKMEDEKKAETIESNIKKVGDKAIEGTNLVYEVRPFYEGNQFYLILKKVYKDVRLVGAPPSSIGKFGFDTDNWVWPRHTGDFSVFRIYADKNNEPAEYNENNQPYKPRKFVPVSLKGVKEGDFTMVYGFPGTTDEYMYSKHLDFTINESLPIAIKMRAASLNIIDRAMRNSEEIKIQYASKQSRISNAYKKYIGQTGGLRRVKAVEKKEKLESLFSAAVSKDKKFQKKYGSVLVDYQAALPAYKKNNTAYMLWREFVYYGPEFIRFVNGYEELMKEEDAEAGKEKMIKKMDNFYKNYQASIDQEILAAQARILFETIDESVLNESMKEYKSKYSGNYERLAADIFESSSFTSKEKLAQWINDYWNPEVRMAEDPAMKFSKAVYGFYKDNVSKNYAAARSKIADTEKAFMAAQMEVLPEMKDYYPNANSTLRVSYGQVSGYFPRDAVKYDYQTKASGILQKSDPDSYEYAIQDKLTNLIESKDFGPYADGDDLPVCFIASNHTSGGNSGSPVFNSEGHLLGLNFDRTWESTMSDMMFDPEICRNITVDARYILFVIDKYAEADYLIEEMQLIK